MTSRRGLKIPSLKRTVPKLGTTKVINPHLPLPKSALHYQSQHPKTLERNMEESNEKHIMRATDDDIRHKSKKANYESI